MGKSKYITYFETYYDENNLVVVYDVLNNEYLDTKSRPDIKQRAEKAINTNTVLVTYERGSRVGFKHLEKNEIEEIFGSLKVEAAKEPTTQPILHISEILSTPKPPSHQVSDFNWKVFIRNVVRAKNLLLVGPSGTGKTQLAIEGAKQLNKELNYYNLGSTQDARATLIGTTHYDTKRGTYFVPSHFVKAIQKPNSIILLDELSRANPEAWNILMTVLDEKQRYLRLDEDENTTTIKVAEGVCFIATTNVGSEYTSTRVLDKALTDRFQVIEVDYLTKNDELNLLNQKFSKQLDYNVLNNVAEIAQKTRTNDGLSFGVSTRKTIELCEYIVDGFGFEEACQIVLYPLYPDSDDGASERTLMRQLVQKYVKPNDEKLADALKNSIFG